MSADRFYSRFLAAVEAVGDPRLSSFVDRNRERVRMLSDTVYQQKMAAKAGKKVTVKARQDVPDMSLEEAREFVWQSVSELAALPPPSPQMKDWQGFSASNDGPLRNWLRMGPDQSNSAYYGAAEYLVINGKQIGMDDLKGALKTLRANLPPDMTPDLAKRLLKGGAQVQKDEGETKEGSYQWTGDKLIVEVGYKKSPKARINGDVVREYGMQRDRDHNWVGTWEGGRKVLRHHVQPHAISNFADLLEAKQRPALAAALRANLPVWLGEAPDVDPDDAPAPPPKRPDIEIIEEDGRILIVGLPYKPGQVLRAFKKRGTFIFKDDRGRWVNGIFLDKLPKVIDALRDSGYDKLAAALQEYAPTPSWMDCTVNVMQGAQSIADIPDADLRRQSREILDSIRWPRGIAPFDYQEVGIAFAELAGGRVIIGDDMGLGKTIQAIGFMKLRPDCTGLVVCPSSVLYKWQSEIKRFAPELSPCVIAATKQKLPARSKGRILITTWDMLRRKAAEFASWSPDTVVADEAHYAKNYKAARSKALSNLASKADNVLLLTGTPAENGTQELYGLLRMVDPAGWPSFADFATRYLGGYKGNYGWEFTGPQNMDEFKARTGCVMIRRLKSEVSDLPEKSRAFIFEPLSASAAKQYSKALAEFEEVLWAGWRKRTLDQARKYVKDGWSKAEAWEWVQQQSYEPDENAAALSELGVLRRVVGRLKVPYALQWIKDEREARPNDPLVVFVYHQAVAEAIAKGVEKMGLRVATVTGKAGSKKKNEITRAFQDGKLDVIIATEALREGVDLYRANRTLFVERWWVPSKEEQAEDRTHRTGQKRNVTIDYLMLEDTIDERLHEIVEDKREELSASIGANEWAGGAKAGSIAAEVLRDVLADLGVRSENNREITKRQFNAALKG